MTKNEVMQRLIDALDKNDNYAQVIALAEIRTALAQPEKEWVGLTDEERHKCWSGIDHKTCISHTRAYGDAIEAKLKEKNT